MDLKHRELKRIAQAALNEKRVLTALRQEVKRVFGTSIVVEGRIEQLARRVNERLEVLSQTGREVPSFKTSLMARLANHGEQDVRQMAARVLPERFARKLMFDGSPAVRIQVAKRLPDEQLDEMVKRFPGDDLLKTYRRERELNEEYDASSYFGRLGKADGVKISASPELTDQWYADQARRMVKEYGEYPSRMPRMLERSWHPLAVKRYCASVKATSGVEIDETKLRGAIDDVLSELDDMYVSNEPLKEMIERLKEQVDREELLSEAVMPVLEEKVTDPVENLLEIDAGIAEYVTMAESVFGIKKTTLPSAIRKHCLQESGGRITEVPVLGTLPHGGAFREVDEKALDRYVRCWNEVQSMNGEPLMLNWNVNPRSVDSIGFELVLR